MSYAGAKGPEDRRSGHKLEFKSCNYTLSPKAADYLIPFLKMSYEDANGPEDRRSKMKSGNDSFHKHYIQDHAGQEDYKADSVDDGSCRPFVAPLAPDVLLPLDHRSYSLFLCDSVNIDYKSEKYFILLTSVTIN